MAHKQVETTFYIQLEPAFRRYPRADGTHEVTSIKPRSMTQNRPAKSAHPVVKITLRLPAAAFLPLAPVVTIDVPAEAIDFTPTVTVELPDVDA